MVGEGGRSLGEFLISQNGLWKTLEHVYIFLSALITGFCLLIKGFFLSG